MSDGKVDLERLRSIGVHPSNRKGQTRVTRDEAGNDTTEHWSGDRVDVRINAPHMKVRSTVKEV